MALKQLIAADLVTSLVNQTFPFPGGIPNITLSVAQNEYLSETFQLTNNKTHWRPDRGSYNGLHGYWIFRPSVRQCWQAVLNAGSYLRYWNTDGQAQGNPEDWELFIFEKADGGIDQVVIRNIYGGYVNFVGGFFRCNAPTKAQAAVFTVAND
jgi:hypothetical protein